MYVGGSAKAWRLDAPWGPEEQWIELGDDPDQILALNGDTLVGTNYHGMVLSTDRGDSFMSTSPGGYLLTARQNPVIIPFRHPYGGTLIAPVYSGSVTGKVAFAALFSRNRGQSWSPSILLEVPTKQGPRFEYATVVERGPRAGRVIVSGTWGLAYSDDGGETFRPVPGRWAYFRFSGMALSVLERGAPGGGDRLLAGFTDPQSPEEAEIIVSDDGGDTWTLIADIRGDPNSQLSAVVDLGDGRALVAMNGGQLWETFDGGSTWTQVGQVPGAINDPERPGSLGRVFWALIGPDGRLYVGGIWLDRDMGPGLNQGWAFRTVDPYVVASTAPPASESWMRVRVRPNPAGASASVSLVAPEPGDATVAVFDTQGREVARVFSGAVAAGMRSFSIDTSGWAAGVYIVRAEVAGRVASARLVVGR